MIKISVALATFNEEKNIRDCLQSVKDIADEIIIVDGNSSDSTVDIANSFTAKIIKVPNDPMFHRMKQLAFDTAKGEWILYLDADEKVSPELAQEVKKIIEMNNNEIDVYQNKLKNRQLFLRHQEIIKKRDGKVDNDNLDYVAFFVPRMNYFLGKYLRFGGVYPDGVIRLFKNKKAYLPCKDVHEQLVVNGRVGWLQNNLIHMADPTFKRYLERNSRYINLIVQEMETNKIAKNIVQAFNYFLFKPVYWFLLTQLRHKGILDGFQGIIFSFFSALRFPRAYWRYLNNN